MDRLDEALRLLGVEQGQPAHWRHVLVMSIQTFAYATGDDELAQATESKAALIRAEVAAAQNN
ncbi:MAG TPA: hypothetical protein VF573_14395 [Paraburkholderia sp.]|uniref:hypothetical protein n=1 Tax=Paraburkholderia sp. TaxID=1926495 RepID=UPI002ED4342E